MNNINNINNLRQLLCEPDTPALKTRICALCTSELLWDMAESHVPGLKAWADRQTEIADALEKHKRRHDEGEVYDDCRFAMKDLSDAYLRYADLRYADLSGANLRLADLRGVDLEGADLRLADLRGVDLRGVDLEGADLSGAYLSGANLEGANLIRATYNERTQFPEGFDPVDRGLVEVQ